MNSKLYSRLLSYSLAFSFLYAAINSFLRPVDWLGYIPSYFKGVLPGELLLKSFSSFEIVLALWLISSWKNHWAGLVSFITLISITLANPAIFDVTFRDISLAGVALVLFLMARENT